MNLIDEIKKTLKIALPDSEVYVLDPRNDQTHLEAIVISPLFIDISLVKQHRMVMHPLKEHFKEGLHALALKTYTPDQWKKRQKSEQ